MVKVGALDHALSRSFGDLVRALLHEGNAHSADGWHGVLEAVLARYGDVNIRRCFRGPPGVYAFPRRCVGARGRIV